MEPLFIRLLREKIVLMTDMRTQEITTTRLTHEDYLYNLGYLEALRHVTDALDEIQDEVRKD